MKLEEDDGAAEKLRKIRNELSADEKMSKLLEGFEAQTSILKQSFEKKFAGWHNFRVIPPTLSKNLKLKSRRLRTSRIKLPKRLKI